VKPPLRPISFHSEIHCGFSSHTPHARLRPKYTILAFICSRLVRRHLLGPPSAWSAVICHPTRAPVGSVTCSHICSVTCARHLLHRLRPSAPSPAPTRSVDPGRHHLLPQGLGPPATAPPRFVSSSCVAFLVLRRVRRPPATAPPRFLYLIYIKKNQATFSSDCPFHVISDFQMFSL
jgi:hypothetical protein